MIETNCATAQVLFPKCAPDAQTALYRVRIERDEWMDMEYPWEYAGVNNAVGMYPSKFGRSSLAYVKQMDGAALNNYAFIVGLLEQATQEIDPEPPDEDANDGWDLARWHDTKQEIADAEKRLEPYVLFALRSEGQTRIGCVKWQTVGIDEDGVRTANIAEALLAVHVDAWAEVMGRPYAGLQDIYKWIDDCVLTFNAIASGDVYWFMVERSMTDTVCHATDAAMTWEETKAFEWEHYDSCGGFILLDARSSYQDARGAVEADMRDHWEEDVRRLYDDGKLPINWKLW
jgi:hypothetical protein